MTKHEWLGAFRGSELTEIQLDAILAFALQASDLETARGLFETKWWDYRFVHPGYGFFLFAHEYGQAVSRWRSRFGISPHMELRANDHPIWRQEKDRRGPSAVIRHVLSPASYRTSMWRAMCHADAYGVPYDRWVSLAFEFAFECKWERMPQPSGLYGTGMVEFILQRWRDETANILRLPADPRYLPAGPDHRWKDPQFDWLMRNIAARPLPHIPLAQYLFREKRIPEHLALSHFGRDVVERARTSALSY